jgi:WD40 repeat protein
MNLFRLTAHTERIQPIYTMHDRTDRIQSLAFSPKNKYLAVGCIDGNFDIYDVKNQFKSLRFKNTSNHNEFIFLNFINFFRR